MSDTVKMRPREYIKIRGANEHNLKSLDVDIPRNEFVVLTGLSGSGKSSLAFDTIYAEGQRRYMESLSSYARQFLGQMEKPNVERIEGLSPAISIDQKSTNRNPRSTVGTVTEIYDYFRLLYARIGIPHCPKCGREIRRQTVDQIVDQVMGLPQGTRIQLLAPVVRGRKGRHEKVLERAYSLGLTREDVIVDGLVSTVGANSKAALETLETIRYCREKGLATICGLSNISFGMPARPYVNTAFLTMAIYEGLTMAIANPSQEMLMCCAMATDLLNAKEGADLRYIQYAAELQPGTKGPAPSGGSASARMTVEAPGEKQNAIGGGENAAFAAHLEKITDAVLKGNRNGIAAMTARALEDGADPAGLLNEGLLPAINRVGDFFEQKKYFLPQRIASAEAMKNAIQVLEPHLLREQDGQSMPVVVIATVEGDIHDIGKNLVALMLKNHGFRVVDLGKDVPKEEIIRAAREHHADLIALSALMTTTMQRMREVVDFARQEGITAKIMIGGAVTTQEYADEIHADGYSKDAAEAVKLARRLLGIMNV